MALTVTIQDQFPLGKISNRLELIVCDEILTVRELIEQRVLQEVALHNSATVRHVYTLVEPATREKKLNIKLGKPKQVDGDKQVKLALKAFEQNGFFILVDDRQVEKLDEVIRITDTTSIDFIKLVPLVGG